MNSHEWRRRLLCSLRCFSPAAEAFHSVSTRRRSLETPICPCRPRRPSDIPSCHSRCCRSPFPEAHAEYVMLTSIIFPFMLHIAWSVASSCIHTWKILQEMSFLSLFLMHAVHKAQYLRKYTLMISQSVIQEAAAYVFFITVNGLADQRQNTSARSHSIKAIISYNYS